MENNLVIFENKLYTKYCDYIFEFEEFDKKIYKRFLKIFSMNFSIMMDSLSSNQSIDSRFVLLVPVRDKNTNHFRYLGFSSLFVMTDRGLYTALYIKIDNADKVEEDANISRKVLNKFNLNLDDIRNRTTHFFYNVFIELVRLKDHFEVLDFGCDKITLEKVLYRELENEKPGNKEIKNFLIKNKFE